MSVDVSTRGNGIELHNSDEGYSVVISYTVWRALIAGYTRIVDGDNTYHVVHDVHPTALLAHVRRGIFEKAIDSPELCIDGAVLTELGLKVWRDIPKELSESALKVLSKSDSLAKKEHNKLSSAGLELLRSWPVDDISAAMIIGSSRIEKGLWLPTGNNTKVLRHLCTEGFVEMGVSSVYITHGGDVQPTKTGCAPSVVWRKTPAGEMRGI